MLQDMRELLTILDCRLRNFLFGNKSEVIASKGSYFHTSLHITPDVHRPLIAKTHPPPLTQKDPLPARHFFHLAMILLKNRVLQRKRPAIPTSVYRLPDNPKATLIVSLGELCSRATVASLYQDSLHPHWEAV